MTQPSKKIWLSLITASLLSGCLEESSDSSEIITGSVPCGPEHATAFSAQESSDNYTAALRLADYGDGASIDLVTNYSISQSNALASTETDYSISSQNGNLYYLGRLDIDTFQKYYQNDLVNGLYQTENEKGYSTRDAGSDTSPNAHNIAFINNSVAIMPRYSESKAWLINLDAQQEDDFKICELDLSAYTTEKISNVGTAEEEVTQYPPHMAFVSTSSQYATITMQRLEGYSPVESAYMAIFDLNTWQEIDTDTSTEGLKGIELNLKNHQGISINNNDIYLSSLVYGDPNTGGIEKISLETLTTETINEESGYSSVSVTDNGNIYAIRYNGWKNNGLFKITDSSSTEVNDTEGSYLTTVASRKNELWLGFGLNGDTQPKVDIFDAENNDAKISTINPLSRNPVSIIFIEE